MLHYADVILYFENTLGYLIHDNMSNLAHKIIEFRETYGYFDYSDFIDYVAELKDINETLKEIKESLSKQNSSRYLNNSQKLGRFKVEKYNPNMSITEFKKLFDKK